MRKTLCHRLIVPALAGLCLLISSNAAVAQQVRNELPQSLITSRNPDRGPIVEFVAAHAERLASEEPTEVVSARVALLSPFVSRGPFADPPSVLFRRVYGRELVTATRPVVEDRRVLNAVNAVLVMGPLLIEESLQALEVAARDEREPVRLAAAGALGDSIDRAAPDSLQRSQGVEAMRIVLARLPEESAAAVANALVGAASVAPTDNEQAVRGSRGLSDALPSMTENAAAAVERREDQAPGWARTLLRAINQVFRVEVTAANQATTGASRDERLRAASEGAAAVVDYARDRMLAVDDLELFEETVEGRALLQAIQAAQRIITTAREALGRGAGSVVSSLDAEATRAVQSRDASIFDRAARAWAAPLRQMGVEGGARRLESTP